jgi:N-acetylglucosamine-6-phosphate deacetylase
MPAERITAPGFVDLQCNGAGGIDLTAEPERLWEVGALLPRWGVTSWLPTIVSSPLATVDRAIAALRGGPPEGWVGAAPLGLHLEGPFLNPEHKGAHEQRHLLRPDLEATAGWSREAGVALVTLAPELAGAHGVVRALTARGVVVSAGHSGATAEEAALAAEAGIGMVTHLFNGMASMHHRRPNLAGWALADDRVRVGMIVDGVHVDPLVVAMARRALGDRLVLVTDAVAALGEPVDAARLADGTLAGATVGMDQAVRNLVAFSDCSLSTAVAAASTTPAALIGAPPSDDHVVLTPDGELVETILGGVPWRS